MSTSGSVKSAERALDVLQLLSASLRPAPASAIARTLGIPRSSTHLLLNVMRDRGWVTYYAADRGWGLGAAAFETGSAYLRASPVQRLAHPLLVDVTAATGCTSHLAVLHGDDVLYLDKELPVASGLRLVTEIGVRLPAHLTAVGRAMLAALPSDQVRALYVHPTLVRRTGRGPFTIGRLLDDLAEVRAQGYALEVGLTTPEIGCAAAAVLSHEGYPTAAVGVTFAAQQHDDASRRALVGQVVAAAGRLTEAIGVRHKVPA